jgi:putative transposase
MRKLSKKKIRWIIRWIDEGFTNKEVAIAQKITPRWVSHIYNTYKKYGRIVVKQPGRPRKPIPLEHIKLILNEHPKNSGAVILEKRIRIKHKIHIPHNRIHMVLKEAGYAKDEPKKQKRRKPWIRYEREHSLSLLHADWYETKTEPRRHVIAYLDDASRLILACDEYDKQNSTNAIKTLVKAMVFANQYGGIKSILTDRGTEFYPTRQDKKGKAKTQFQKFLEKHGINHIVGRVKHPQTNGKIERWFQTYRKKRDRFNSLGEFLEWYNTDRMHMSLNMHYAETPYQAFIRKMDPIVWLNRVGWFD